VDNIKIDLRETGWDGVDWIDLAQDRDQWRALVNTVNLRVPQNAGKFLSGCTIGGFSGSHKKLIIKTTQKRVLTSVLFST
jgi:hypothetical protein